MTERLKARPMQGAAVSARAKLRTGAVQSVAAAFSGAMGPVLCVNSRRAPAGAPRPPAPATRPHPCRRAVLLPPVMPCLQHACHALTLMTDRNSVWKWHGMLRPGFSPSAVEVHCVALHWFVDLGVMPCKA